MNATEVAFSLCSPLLSARAQPHTHQAKPLVAYAKHFVIGFSI